MSERFILSGGLICDGTGQTAFQGELLVNNGVIEQVRRGVSASAEAIPRVDCQGYVVAPGFIDMTSSMDFYAEFGGSNYFDGFTQQGVTSFVTGQGGFSPFATVRDSLHQTSLNQPPFDIGRIEQPTGRLQRFNNQLNDIHHNIVPMAGHGSCRLSIAGFESRALSSKELDMLIGILEESLQDGAVGVSVGLNERPGMFASSKELKAVASLVQRYNKLLRVHARTQMALSGHYSGMNMARHNLLAVDELITLARKTGVKLQCSQLAFQGDKTWQTMDQVLSRITSVRESGVDLQFDFSPHSVSNTSLINLLPHWFIQNWKRSSQSVSQRSRLQLWLGVNFAQSGFGLNDIKLVSAHCKEYERCEGERLDAIASNKDTSSMKLLLDLLDKSDGRARVMLYERFGPGMVQQMMGHECALFSSGAVPEPLSRVHNPSAVSAFPRLLQIARNSGAVSMEHCVRKMTGAVADRVGLRDIGYLLEGKRADMTVFSWKSVMDLTDFAGYDAKPDGIEQVYIGGECLLRNSRLVKASGLTARA